MGPSETAVRPFLSLQANCHIYQVAFMQKLVPEREVVNPVRFQGRISGRVVSLPQKGPFLVSP
jgi:hypothetical protein